MHNLQKGDIINKRYEIVAKHGTGTLGTVIYLGRDIQQNCDVLIRILTSDLLADEDMVSRFMRGVDLAKKLKHPNILGVVDAGEEDNIRYVITNFEKGFFLNEYLDHRGLLDEKEAIRLIKSLSEALEYAWKEQEVIHRNISPDTILVAKGNIPMLTDFDLAKSLIADSHLTLQGLAIGDPLYMSPEQAKGEAVDFHSDIYCLGLVFYQLLSGSPPFSDKSKMQILKAQVAEKHIPIQSKNSDVSNECAAVLDKMLAKDAKERYNSWSAVISDLNAVLDNKKDLNQPSSTSKAQTSGRYKMQAVDTDLPGQQEKTVKIKNEIPIEKTQPIDPDSLGTKTPGASIPKLLSFAIILVIVIVGIIFLILKTEHEDSKQAEVKQLTDVGHNVTVNLPAKSQQVSSVPASDTEAKYREACMNNLKQISVALDMYANVFNGKYPEASGAKGLDKLRSGGFLSMSQVFVCPETGHIAAAPGAPITEDTCDYVYVGGLTEYSDPNTPILWSKPGNHKDYGNILYVNGKIKSVSGSNWLSKIKKKSK